MDDPATFWRYAPLWGSIVVLIVIAVVFRRLKRSHKPVVPPRAPPQVWTGAEEDNLDSSHIGGPIFVNPADRNAPPDPDHPAASGEPVRAPK